MRNMMTIRCSRSRLLATALVLGFAGLLGGCGSMSVPSWDPSDLLDFLDTKKRAPGERKPVFPEGVPGITPGVPKDLVRGSAESRAAAASQAAAAAPPSDAAAQQAQQGKRFSKSTAKQPPAQTTGQVEIAPDDVNVEDEAMPPTPPPPPRRQARTRTTAPPPDQPQASPAPQQR